MDGNQGHSSLNCERRESAEDNLSALSLLVSQLRSPKPNTTNALPSQPGIHNPTPIPSRQSQSPLHHAAPTAVPTTDGHITSRPYLHTYICQPLPVKGTREPSNDPAPSLKSQPLHPL